MSSSDSLKSWGELLCSYRKTYGSQAYSSVTGGSSGGDHQVRYTRSVPTVCPLAEIKHPLYACGSAGEHGHTINYQDGSLQRSQFHGWGDVSLLKQEQDEGCQGGQTYHPPPRGTAPHKPTGKRFVPAPCKQGRNGLFGLLQGTEAGGVDSWIGNPQIDPTKGKRAVTAPTDPKRTADMGQLLAQTAPGAPSSDAWLGNIQIDPAKGKGHAAADPASMRGRADLFAILQQQILQENGGKSQKLHAAVCAGGGGSSAVSRGGSIRRSNSSSIKSSSSGGGCGSVINVTAGGGNNNSSSSTIPATIGSGSKATVNSRQSPADQDAWLGNRLIQPNKGKKPVDDSPAATATLHAATFKDGVPADGCWCDLPPIGKRPLSPPSNARHFVTAAQTMAIEVPLPSSAVLGTGKPHGKSQIADPYATTNPSRVDMYALMTFKPLANEEAGRCQHSWTDAAVQPRKKCVAPKAGGAGSWQALLAAGPAQPVRFVPRGGLAQERGMTLDAIIANRKHFKR